MDITICLVLITTLYGILMFFDMFFKSCAHYPYIQFLKGLGIEIKFLQIQWNTTAFNRIFLRWGNQMKFLNTWFNIGLYTTLFLLPISLILLVIAISQNMFHTTKESSGNLVIEPLIPGVNIPGSELGYYSLSLIVCSIIHEFGHALASVKEDVHIINVGVYILFVLPVAYVNLSSDNLCSLSPWRGLKVLCAGIWHNLVLSLIAYLLYSTLPYFYSTVFQVNQGVLVNDLTPNSPLAGDKGLGVNDVIKSINLCNTYNEKRLVECLANIEKVGFCVDTDLVHNLDESVPLRAVKGGFDCCHETKSDRICFEYIEKMDGVLEIPPHACLPARVIVETSKHNCGGSLYCPNNLHCIKPMLDNYTSLFKISREDKQDVIYIGHPSDILQTVKTSSFIPKYSFSGLFYPNEILKFLEYIIVISIGLALVNVIPCLFMDGQHITNSLVQLYTKDSKPIAMSITLLCTILLIFHCIYTIFLKWK